MDRASFFDSYVEEETMTKESLAQCIHYLEGLNQYLLGVKTAQDFSQALFQFLRSNSFSEEAVAILNKICQGLSSNDTVYAACIYLTDTFRQVVASREKEHEEASGELADLRSDVVSHIERQLGEVGVSITGDYGELENQIKSTDDVERLRENIDCVVDYLKEREEVIGKNETDVTLSTDEVIEATEKVRDTTILENVQEAEQVEEQEAVDGLSFDEENHVILEVDKTHKESMDFAKMMMLGLLTSYATSDIAKSSFGMQIEKGERQINDFTVKFGANNFSKEAMAMDGKVTNQIMELAKSFQTSTDYTALLTNASPELQCMVQLFEKGVLGKEGAFRLGVRQDGAQLGFAMKLGGQFSEVADALSTNGAPIVETPAGDYYCQFRETVKGDTLSTLTSTNETLDSLNDEKALQEGGAEKKNTSVLVKTLDLPTDHAALVNPYLLIAVSIFEVLSLLLVLFSLSLS